MTFKSTTNWSFYPEGLNKVAVRLKNDEIFDKIFLEENELREGIIEEEEEDGFKEIPRISFTIEN